VPDHVLNCPGPLRLQAAGVVPVLYASQWLLTCFSCPFPVSFSCRLIDIMLQVRSIAHWLLLLRAACLQGRLQGGALNREALPSSHPLVLASAAGGQRQHIAEDSSGHPGGMRGGPADAGGEQAPLASTVLLILESSPPGSCSRTCHAACRAACHVAAVAVVFLCG
jgi:hypothetical protein